MSLELLFTGPTFQCTDIVIVDDGVEELTEVFRVVLSSNDPVFAPSIGTAVVIITDDDNGEYKQTYITFFNYLRGSIDSHR